MGFGQVDDENIVFFRILFHAFSGVLINNLHPWIPQALLDLGVIFPAKIHHPLVDLDHQDSLQAFELDRLLQGETVAAADNSMLSGLAVGQ